MENNLGTESFMKVVVSSPDETFERIVSFPKGGGESAAYTVLLVAKKFLQGHIEKKGLVTLKADIITLDELLTFMREMDWMGTFVKH